MYGEHEILVIDSSCLLNPNYDFLNLFIILVKRHSLVFYVSVRKYVFDNQTNNSI